MSSQLDLVLVSG